MRFVIQVLLVFFVISALLSILRGFLSPTPTPRRRANNEVPPPPTNPNRLVKDPVCGTYIPEQTAIRAGEHFFCSQECRTKYLAG